jgi:predicted ATPase
VPLDSEQARFRLLDHLSGFFRNLARRRAVVIVLDDLHSADKASLSLLRFLASELRDARVLILGTCRDVDLGRDHPLVHTMAELARERHAERVVLRGIGREDVAHYIELTVGVTAPPDLVEAVFRETEGNPFFVGEIVRLLVSEERLEHAGEASSWVTHIPEGVREAIARRLARLSEDCNGLLSSGAVMGRELDLEVLERVSGLGEEDFSAALEEAIAARVVAAPAEGRRRSRFSHVLIQESLYAEIPALGRARAHRRIGEALELVHGGALEPHLDELAHHFVAAGDVEKGVRYATRAAEQASARLAFDQAARHYEAALRALEPGDAAQDPHRCELLLALGEAHAHAGDPGAAREACTRAAELARRLADPDRLARAALGYGGPWAQFSVEDERLVALLEEARRALGEGDGALRAMVLARLAAELYFSEPHEVRAALSLQAVEIAGRVGDPAVLAYTLNARHGALWGPEDVEERLAVASQIVELANRAAAPALAVEGHARRVVDLLELGDIAAVDAEIASHAALAATLRDPRQLWYAAVWRAMRAQFDGRFAEAVALAEEAYALGSRLHQAEAGQCHTVQMWICRVEQGRGAELVALFERWDQEIDTVPGWHAALAQLYGELGREADARRVFAPLAASRFEALPRDSTWLRALACAAEACAILADPQAAAILYDLLLPYARRNIVAVEGWSCEGAAARLLGMLATTMGSFAEAEERFETALELNELMGARAWLARTQFQYGDMLLARDEPGDRARARDLLLEAIGAARELGMKTLMDRALLDAHRAGG